MEGKMQTVHDLRPARSIVVALMCTSLVYLAGLAVHRAMAIQLTKKVADSTMGRVQKAKPVQERLQVVRRREVPADPPDPNAVKSDLAQAVSRAVAVLPEEDVLWIVEQTISQEHGSASEPLRTTG